MSRHDVNEWYRRSYPHAPRHNERAMATLAALGPLYNLRRFGERRLDGGVRTVAGGLAIEVHLRTLDMATFDGGELTALVLAAHQYRCRVQLDIVGRHARLMIHPREPAGKRTMSRHPGLEDLAARAALREAHGRYGITGQRPDVEWSGAPGEVAMAVRIPRPAEEMTA